jgi:hypothetical protein
MLVWNPSWGDAGDLGTHRGFVSNPRSLPSTTTLEFASVASFIYTPKDSKVSQPRLTFILHPNFEDKCHALTLKNIDRDVLVEKIWPVVKNGLDDPYAFYHEVYKPSSLYQADAYRTYLVKRMNNIFMFTYHATEEGVIRDAQEESK